MIQVSGLQLLYKEESIYDSFVSKKTKILLVVNNKDTYESSEQKQHEKLVKWPKNSMPPIEVGQNLSNFQFDFKFVKGGNMVGKAKSFMVLGHSRKDCLDVINDKFEVIGKFLYEGKWVYGHSQKQYNFQPKTYAKQIMKEKISQYPGSEDNESHKTKKKKRQSNSDDEGGNNLFASLFSCCTTKRKPKKKLLIPKIANILVDYQEGEIQTSGEPLHESFPIQYYSEKVFISH